MLIPLGTDRPLRTQTLLTYILIALNVGVAAVLTALDRFDPGTAERLIRFGWLSANELAPWRFITYAFLHGGLLHLLGNMLVLWVFGPNVEDRLGKLGFLALYLAGAVAAGAAHVFLESVPAPVVGASGAIAAVTGAYLILFPRTNVRCLLIFFLIGIFWIPAAWFIGFAIFKDIFWLAAATQTVGGQRVSDGVARLAHLGGYLLGAGSGVVLLWTGLIGREAYDLFTIGRQAYRRRQLRGAAAAKQAAVQRKLDPRRKSADDARADAMASRRAEVAALLSRGEPQHAMAAYRSLVDTYADLPGSTTLSRQHQADLANHFFIAKDYAAAAFAYDRFYEAYPKDARTPSIRLMIALLNARYLNDPVRAKAVLDGLEPELDGHERALARELADELA